MLKLHVEPQEFTKVTEAAGMIPVSASPGLEALTGADALLTPLPIPLTPALLPKHIEAGALLIQIKRGHDLSSSIVDNRINHALARMVTHAPSPAQRIILFIGVASAGLENNLLIDNRAAKANGSEYMAYSLYTKTQFAIAARGGSFFNIPNASCFEKWCLDVSDKMREIKAEPVKHIFGETPSKASFVTEENPLQDVRLIPGAWQFIGSLVGVGPKLIYSLVAEYGGQYGKMLEELTNPREVSAIAGLGKGKIRNIRHELNLKPWEYIGILLDRQIMTEYGGWDDYRCATCPRRGETRMFQMGDKWVYCDQECHAGDKP